MRIKIENKDLGIPPECEIRNPPLWDQHHALPGCPTLGGFGGPSQGLQPRRCLCGPYHNTNCTNEPPFTPLPFDPLLGLGGTPGIDYSFSTPAKSHGWIHTMEHPLSQGLVLIYSWALPAL